MLLLALDTSGAAVTVALHDGRGVVARRSTLDARRHAELLAPSVEAVLAEAAAARTDLTDVAVGVGPGPFTGLRVGIVTARVLGLALGVPVHGVCSLDALALQVAQDPGRRSLRGSGSSWRRTPAATSSTGRPTGPPGRTNRRNVSTAPHVTSPGELPGDVRTFGRGGTLYPDVRAAPGPLDVDAGAVAQLAVLALLALGAPGTSDRMSLLPPDPLYLRRPDAAPPGARKRVLR